MQYSQRRLLAVVCVLVWGAAATLLAADPRLPTARDRCRVCGMFVAKYPNWVATVIFADGSRAFFDGPKDLFLYLLNLEEYKAEDRVISEVFVTDYYSTELIDAKDAFFISGSDVLGPMGQELVPVAEEGHAKTFFADHGGESILRFGDITPEKIPR